MTRLEEGFLAFEFGTRWKVIKLDDHSDYRNRIEKLDGTKAVDFLGLLDDQNLYFVEVKDFRGYRIENTQRVISGDLAIEIGQKVRDSIACIVGAYHTSSNSDLWDSFLSKLCRRDSTIRIVVWLEIDMPSHFRQRERVLKSIATNIFKQRLIWLTSRIVVSNSIDPNLPDMEVSNLPRNQD